MQRTQKLLQVLGCQKGFSIAQIELKTYNLLKFPIREVGYIFQIRRFANQQSLKVQAKRILKILKRKRLGKLRDEKL